jgi:hypothetical protein
LLNSVGVPDKSFGFPEGVLKVNFDVAVLHVGDEEAFDLFNRLLRVKQGIVGNKNFVLN